MDRKTKWFYWQIALAVSVLLFCWTFWVYLSDPQAFPIAAVKIEAPYRQVPRVRLQNTIAPFMKASFFGFSGRDLRRAILALPWVADAQISRVWPNTVRVKVTERRAAFHWNDNGLISDKDVLYFPIQKYTKILPQLFGPEKLDKQVLQQYRKLSTILRQRGLTIDVCRLTKAGAWEVQLNNGMHLMLGAKDSLARVRRFVTTYHRIFGSNGTKVARVDLRYQHGMAVKWK
jgi:cell division protein FtsQ